MSTKKRKVDSECRVFQEKWTNMYFFVAQGEKCLCLICKESLSVFKEHNIKRHYDSKHKQTYNKYVGVCRENKITNLQSEIGGLTKLFNNAKNINESIVRASYRVGHIIGKEVHPFSDGEFVKRCLMAVVEEVCPEKKSAFESVSLSRMTMTRRIEDLGSDLMVQLKSKASQFKMFSIATDESTDVTDIAQLLVFIRGINNSFEVTEELAAMKSIKTTTTGEDLFKEVSEIFDDLNLDWNKLTAITTDGAPSMVGRHNGLVARLRKKVLESNGSPPLDIHCIIHQQNLCGKILNLDHVMKVVTKSVNLIRSYSTNHRIFKEFLLQIEAEYGDVVYHSEIRWLSRGRVLQRFFDLRYEIDIFFIEKSTQLHELSNPVWLWDLAILCDLTAYVNELNLKLQCKDKLISHVYADLCAFQTKLKLFIQQTEKGQLTHFPTCTALRKERKNDHFPNEKISKMLQLLSKSFEDRFADFHRIKNEIRLFENPFTVDVSTAPGDLQLELIELQCQTPLQDLFREKSLPDFYAALDSYPNLRNLGMKMTTAFASTYICEQTFSTLKRAKPASRARLSDDHLHSILRMNVTQLEPNIKKLVSEKQHQTSH